MEFPESFNLADYFLFDRLKENLGGETALRFGERHWTYDAVAEKSRAFASLLIEAGVARGERVLIVLPDVPPFAWVFFGTLAAGAVVAMGNPDVPAKSIEYLAEYTQATAIVTVPKVKDACKFPASVRALWTVPDAPTGGDTEVGDLADALARTKIDASRFPRTHRDEPAIWLFTSGSTGEPKANIHAHRDFAWSTEVYAKKTVGYRKGDVTVSVPRLYFGYATGTNLMFPFAVGATVGLFSERPTPESLARAITMYQPTIVTNVPTMLGKLLEHDAALRAKGEAGLDFSSIRFSLSAGEALPGALLDRWLERFKSDVYDGIGSAEMFHIYASNRPGDVKPGSLGKAVEGYELRILPEDATGPGAPEVARGEIGVLWVKGDSVSMGYWLDRDKSWKTFFGHWCRTGDLFRIDDEGYLYFAGRADELLKVSGLWVSPVEVEECLMKHEAVQLAAVIGVEEEGLVKTKAFVIVRAGHTANAALATALQEFAKERMAKHKYPRVIEFVDDVPKNDRGKVDRKALRARACEVAQGCRMSRFALDVRAACVLVIPLVACGAAARVVSTPTMAHRASTEDVAMSEDEFDDMLFAQMADAAVPLPDYSELLPSARVIDFDVGLVTGAFVACPTDVTRSPRPFIDVNGLVQRRPARGARMLVAGRRRDFLFESMCRSARNTLVVPIAFAESFIGCAREDETVVVDAKVVDCAATGAGLSTDADVEPCLTDARVIAYPTASAVCNFAREQP